MKEEPLRPGKRRESRRGDWKTCPMPAETETFVLERAFTAKEMETLRRGHVPQAMEDKWFRYMEGPVLFAHRSWTGLCIYRVEFNADGRHIVTVNRNADQYKGTDTEEDREALNKLLDRWVQDPYDPEEEWLSETYDALQRAGKG